jgi:hypothetical protein
MVVTILLVADDSVDTLEVSRTVDVSTSNPSWQHDLVGSIGEHARETARCLLAQLAPTPPQIESDFVPLASLVPVI